MFELARSLRPFEIGNKHGDLVARSEAKLTCTDKVFSICVCILALSSVIFPPIHLFIVSVGLLSMFIKMCKWVY